MNNGHTQKLMDMIMQEYSWEQTIYKLISLENLDPWDLDLSVLADSFIKYVMRLENMDFRVPARYVAVAAVLLRMKSDHVRILKEDEIFNVAGLTEGNGEALEMPEGNGRLEGNGHIELDPGILEVPLKRRPVRRVVITELVAALKRALGTQYRRDNRISARKERVKIEYTVDITQRINNLYGRINSIMDRIDKNTVKFSSVVEKWERPQIIESFVPLVHLDNDRSVNCSQEKLFDEIFIRRGQAPPAGRKAAG
jgi:chromatin segregation and condensation protein Rec8/ScpA/Scc1 (kleisin family)